MMSGTMDKTPLVSVIVPVYMAESYLTKCIDSILCQTYTNLEIILVEDGSPDKCSIICDEYVKKNSHIKVIHKQNEGVSSARNDGLDIAQGEYVMFVDADDSLPKNSIELLTVVAMETNADIVNGRESTIESEVSSEKKDFIKEYKNDEILICALKDNPITHAVKAKLIKRTFIAQIRFDRDIRIHEDSMFIFRCCINNPVFVDIDEIVYFYSETPDSASRSKFSSKYFDILTVANRKCMVLKDREICYPNLEKNIRIKANMALLMVMLRNWNPKWIKKEIICIREIKKTKDEFIPAGSSDKKWFWIITHNLYQGFKCVYSFKCFFFKLKSIVINRKSIENE